MTDDVTQARNIQRLCPILSSAITYEIQDKKGKKQRVHSLAESPCILGRCQLYDVGERKCGLLVRT